MNRKNLTIILIFTLIITNLATYKITSLSVKGNNYYLVKMKGESKNWLVSDYQIAYILPNEHGEEGNARFFYKGSFEELRMDSIQVELYDYFQEGNQPHHISNLAFVQTDNYFKMGGGRFFISKDLSLEDINNNTYFLLTWETKNGNKYEEKIQLELDYDLPIIENLDKTNG